MIQCLLIHKDHHTTDYKINIYSIIKVIMYYNYYVSYVVGVFTLLWFMQLQPSINCHIMLFNFSKVLFRPLTTCLPQTVRHNIPVTTCPSQKTRHTGPVTMNKCNIQCIMYISHNISVITCPPWQHNSHSIPITTCQSYHF